MHKVTVIIAAFEAASTIERAIRSVLSEPNVAEIIVVDDASTDGTADVARACDDGSGRLTVLVQDKNLGPSAARNRAIRHSVSPWMTVLDSDDFMLPHRISGLLAQADKYGEEIDVIADDMYQVDEQDINGPRRLLLGGRVSLPMKVDFSVFVMSNVTHKNRERAELGFIKPLIRRSFLETHAITYREDMRLGEDFELYARALGCGARMVVFPAQGYVSVVRPASLSSRHSEHDLLQLRNCDDDLMADLPLSSQDKMALRHHYLGIDCRLQWRYMILAVKHRDIFGMMKIFFRPMPVPVYVLGKLWEQFVLRVLNRKTG